MGLLAAGICLFTVSSVHAQKDICQDWISPSIHVPSERYGHAMAYDSVRGVSVLFGGFNGGYLGETWEWNGTRLSI